MQPFFIVIIAVFAGSGFYAVLNLLRHRRVPFKKAVPAALLIALLSGGHLYLLFKGNTEDVGFAANFLYLTAFCAVFSILALPPVLISDIVLSIVRLKYGRGFLTRPRILARRKAWSWVLTIFLCFFSGLGLYNAVKAPTLKYQDIYVQNLPASLEGLKIAQLTDVHVSPFFTRPRSEAMVQLVNEAAPDLIVFTGDQVDGTPEMREDALLPFTTLKAPLGMYFIPGNHEYILSMANWRDWYQKQNLTLLMNQHVSLTRGDGRINVAGLDDEAALTRGGTDFSGPDIDKALNGAPKADFTLLLAHQPRQAEKYSEAQYGIDLMLCGHTHGGQIPILRSMTAATNHGFVAGLYHLGGMQLYVSEGSGLWQGFCARLDTEGEITIFTLKRAQ